MTDDILRRIEANIRLEGQELNPAHRDLLKKYIAGELTREQCLEKVKGRG